MGNDIDITPSKNHGTLINMDNRGNSKLHLEYPHEHLWRFNEREN